ncbi:hypothetical protein GCM10009734_64600 [Nonomuraea bangladeshensis]|jgi:hypothetical protein
MIVIGALLGLFVVFNFLLPLLAGLFKLALIVGLIALVLFVVVTVMSKSSRSQ